MKKQIRKKKEKKKLSLDFLDSFNLNDFIKGLPEAFFIFYMVWFSYTIISNSFRNELYQKYMKKSLIQGRKYIDNYFPGFLSNNKNKFDYDVLIVKTKEIITCFGGLYLLGVLMLFLFSSKKRKILLFISLLLDLLFIHNLIYYKNENLFDIILIIVYIIILIYVWKINKLKILNANWELELFPIYFYIFTLFLNYVY